MHLSGWNRIRKRQFQDNNSNSLFMLITKTKPCISRFEPFPISVLKDMRGQ